MTRLFRLFSITFLLSFSLNACSGSAPIYAPSLTPKVITTSIATFIAASAIPILSTPTPPSTPTPEAPIINMTLEDWKKVFSGQMTGQDGSIVELGSMFSEDINTIYTSADYNKINELPVGTPFVILNPDGKITFYANPSVAAERAKAGAIILVSKNSPIPDGINLAIEAATLQYEKGNNNVYVEFDEVTGELSFNPGVRIYLKSILNSSIVRMPKHFKVGHIYQPGESTLKEAGLNITDPNNWLDDLLKAGYTAIILYAQ